MKTILLPVADDEGAPGRMTAATAVARAFGAHIVCLHVTPLAAYVMTDSFGGIYSMPDIVAAEEGRANALETAAAAALDSTGLAWSFERACGDPAQMIAMRARLADLIILPRAPAPRERRGPPPLAGDVALHAGIPVLALAPGVSDVVLDGIAVVAWNGSQEAGNAVRRSLPFLARARAVEVLTVDEGMVLDYPAEHAVQYLAREGIAATARVIGTGDGPAGDVIMDTAIASGAAYVVMGAFGHSRAREFLLGGVTRRMLSESTLPLLLAH